ncbi:dihydrofolate reductase [Candidatus Woesearchaeota archaeon]|nr:dihydrofolate reductase [Candidatus Woesearchaeota archaeon]
MIIAIAAMTKKKHVIGKDNWMPWDIKEELDHFRKQTKDSVVIMGGKTYRSINRPMPNRVNIVISRSMDKIEGCETAKSVDEALEKSKSYEKTIFVIGGAEIYRQTIDKLDKMYLSFIKKEYEGDTFFPQWDETEWEIEKKEDHDEWEFVIFRRKK